MKFLGLFTDSKTEQIQKYGTESERNLLNLSKEELLERLIISEQKVQSLSAELAAQKQEIGELKDMLTCRKLELEEAGNLAEASLKLNGVLEAAQQTADDYLANVRSLSEQENAMRAEREEESQKEIRELKKKAARECESLQKKTEEDCWILEEETKASCDLEKAEAREEIEKYWQELTGRLDEFYEAHAGLQELLSLYNVKVPEDKHKK